MKIVANHRSFSCPCSDTPIRLIRRYLSPPRLPLQKLRNHLRKSLADSLHQRDFGHGCLAKPVERTEVLDRKSVV